MAAKRDAQVFKQWEAPATATVGLNFADRLVSLIKAASQDDVQPQAAKALENLGARCLVSDDLVSQGIDALNGNQSIRLRDTKAFIGLSSGGIAALFRTSTSCIQAFLLVTALEACGYGEGDTGEVIYHMLSYTDVLRSSPASIRQIQAAVKVISGHSLKLISVSAAVTVNEIIHALDALRTLQPNRSTAACWGKLPHETLAEILVKAFDQLQDDDVNYVEISGSVGLVWIILTLFWLNKDKVGLFHGSTCLLGPEDCKIRIHPLLENITDMEAGAPHIKQDNWTFKSWVKGEPISQMVKSQDRTNPAHRFNEPGFIPSYLARSYYLTRFRSEEATEALRAVAEAYVAAALNTPMESYYCIQLWEPLSSVVRKDPSQDLIGPNSTLFMRLGWISKPIPQLSVAALVEEVISSCLLGNCQKHKDELGLLAYDRLRIQEHLHECFNACPQVELRPEEVGEFLEAALSVAAHALTYLFLRLTKQNIPVTKSNTDSVASEEFPLFYGVRTHTNFWEATFKPPSLQKNPVVNLVCLRESILKTAVGTKSRLLHREGTVAVSASGRTAIIAPIFDYSIEKVGILDVYLVPGNIRFQDMAVDNIVEDLDIKEDRFFPRLDVIGKVWDIIHHFSVEGNLLLMRTLVKCKASLESSRLQSGQWTVHYTKCVDHIARSIQLNERRKDTLISQDIREDANTTRFRSKVWTLVQSQFFPIFPIENMMIRGRRLVKILPGEVPRRCVSVIDSAVTTEVLFFGLRAELLQAPILMIQGDANLDDLNREILHRLFFNLISVYERMQMIEPHLDLTSTGPQASRGPAASYFLLPNGNQKIARHISQDIPVEEIFNFLMRQMPSWTIMSTS